MLHQKKSSLGTGTRKVSPPQPVCMTLDQKASYLADLRTNRPARPTGARPLPSRPFAQPANNENLPPKTDSAPSFRQPVEQADEDKNILREHKLIHRASMPNSSSLGSLDSQKGRPLVPSPSNGTPLSQRRVSPPSTTTPYRETPARVREREEAHKLRQQLERIDQEGDESRIHNAAKMEAADLVWKHRNPQLVEVEKTAAYRNPDLDKKDDTSTNRKYGELGHAKKEPDTCPPDSIPNSRSASGESTASTDSKRSRLPWLRKRPKAKAPTPSTEILVAPASAPQEEPPPTHENILQKSVRKISGKRHTSSGSSKGIFRNPEDEIFEEAEQMPVITEQVTKQQLPLRSRESNALPRGSRPLPEKSYTDPFPDKPRPNRVEIWRNTPSQSRNAGYTPGRALPQTPLKELEVEPNDSPKYKDGYEVRSDDIRAATSMRKSDRSPNLPTPTAVSDRPGRPIVSFDRSWKPGNNSPRNSHDLERPSRAQTPQSQNKNDGSMVYPVKPIPPIPEITIVEDPRSPALQKEQQLAAARPDPATMPVPSIALYHDEPQSSILPSRPLPQINLPQDQSNQQSQFSQPIPQINLPDKPTPSSTSALTTGAEQPNSRPLPFINVQHGSARPLSSVQARNAPPRPLPVHTQSSPSKLPPRPTNSELASRVPWLSRTPTSASTSSVACTACSLPISGRIVTASGSSTTTQKARFHPECFTCHYCSTGLEAVAFYPEPENARQERIAATLPHLDPEGEQIKQIVRGNEELHFFCHLDYHELFSPRCHNCKTPIEGAVVLALGHHYHADHFFCAECGDPFTSESPFVEHNDYPYCVSCHTKRTSARCRMCKQPILNEMTVEALGGKWHEACFVCCDCRGDFGEEGRFFVREVEIELTEKQRRKGLGPTFEEKAACQACEETRVKNVNIFL